MRTARAKKGTFIALFLPLPKPVCDAKNLLSRAFFLRCVPERRGKMALPEALFIAQKEKNESEKEKSKEKGKEKEKEPRSLSNKCARTKETGCRRRSRNARHTRRRLAKAPGAVRAFRAALGSLRMMASRIANDENARREPWKHKARTIQNGHFNNRKPLNPPNLLMNCMMNMVGKVWPATQPDRAGNVIASGPISVRSEKSEKVVSPNEIRGGIEFPPVFSRRRILQIGCLGAYIWRGVA